MGGWFGAHKHSPGVMLTDGADPRGDSRLAYRYIRLECEGIGRTITSTRMKRPLGEPGGYPSSARTV